MYKAIIFDLDGTLIDTLDDLKDSINHALKYWGYNISYSKEETKNLIGSGIKNLCKRSLAPITDSEEEIDKVFNKFKEEYKQRQLDKTKPYDGINEALLTIKQAFIKTAVLSNKADANTKIIINHFFEEGMFEIVQGQVENVPIKPDPTSVNMIIKYLGVDKKEVLYIGDSDVDMKTAINAGLDFVAVSWGFRSIDLLKTYNPTYIANTPDDIVKIIKK